MSFVVIADEIVKTLLFRQGVKCLFSLTIVWAHHRMFSMFNHGYFQRQLHFVAAFSLLMLSTVQDFILYHFRAPHVWRALWGKGVQRVWHPLSQGGLSCLPPSPQSQISVKRSLRCAWACWWLRAFPRGLWPCWFRRELASRLLLFPGKRK